MNLKKATHYHAKADAILYHGDCLDFLGTLPESSVSLVVTSPPYNLGKGAEVRLPFQEYLQSQRDVIEACDRVLKPNGSICWQVGTYIPRKGEIIPLDLLLYPFFSPLGYRIRNRIVWTFGHGAHCKRRFSGRYETILWFTKSDDYTFNLDPVRVPQKYPGKKAFKGPRRGEYSCNPLGKSPGDSWVFPNVKANHVEYSGHGRQHPLELVGKLVLALTNKGEVVLDPFAGAGTSIVAALMHSRKAWGAESDGAAVALAKRRIAQWEKGELPMRPWGPPQLSQILSQQVSPFSVKTNSGGTNEQSE